MSDPIYSKITELEIEIENLRKLVDAVCDCEHERVLSGSDKVNPRMWERVVRTLDDWRKGVS